MFSKFLTRIAFLAALVPAVGMSLSCAPAMSGAVYQTETDVINRSDWVVLVRASRLPKYMNYGGSKLYPLTEVRCSYLKWANGMAVGPVHYQDLWYHSGMPVGVKRYALLPVEKFDMGVIYVQASQDNSPADTRSLANAIIRLQLDLSLSNFVVTAVLVPEQMYDQLISDFGSFGFHQRQKRAPGAVATIHVMSNPDISERFLYLDK